MEKFKEEIKAVKILIGKSKDSHSPTEAIQFAGSALNCAEALEKLVQTSDFLTVD
jgi:hypothetical protein